MMVDAVNDGPNTLERLTDGGNLCILSEKEAGGFPDVSQPSGSVTQADERKGGPLRLEVDDAMMRLALDK